MTRKLGDDAIVLAVCDGIYGVTPGAALRAFPALLPLVAAEGRCLVLPTLASFGRDQEIDLRDDAVGCLVSVPLSIGPDKPFGMVYGAGPRPHDDPDALHALQPVLGLLTSLLGTVLALDLDRSRLQRQVDAAESAALSDELTGLGNRRAFERAVANEQARCERFGHLAGIVMLDLDGLKETNDANGHAAGDDLLRRCADVLRDWVRDADQAFRVGGDEFAVLMPEVSADHLESVHERLHRAFADARVSASIGVSIRRSDGDLRDTVAEADAAMYVEKSRLRR